jgi:hypothetical protein
MAHSGHRCRAWARLLSGTKRNSKNEVLMSATLGLGLSQTHPYDSPTLCGIVYRPLARGFLVASAGGLRPRGRSTLPIVGGTRALAARV